MLAAAIALLAMIPSRAIADECAATHSIFAPLPDACLAPIDTDRPHQTDTPHVVPAGHTQVESALAAAQLGGAVGAPPGARAPHLLLFENAYKFGLVSDVDLQLIVKHAEYSFASDRLAPPGPLVVRAKFAVVHEDGAIPAITIVPAFFAPASRAQPTRGGLIVFWGWELPWDFELEMNAGALASTSPKPPVAIVLAAALTRHVAPRLRMFADVYATGYDVQLGTGLLFALARDVQLDAGTYVGVNGDVAAVTPFVGISARR